MDLFESAKQPLIALPAQPSIDAIASAIALAHVADRLEKTIVIISPHFEPPAPLAFLKGVANISPSVSSLKRFRISINTEHTHLADFYYTIGEKILDIFLTPSDGSWSENDVLIHGETWQHDLAIVIDSKELDTLGDTFEQHAEFFYQTPVVNIDHHLDNGNFGQVNLIDPKASSASEIIYESLSASHPHFIDDQVATALLTGIIAKTQSFRLAAAPKTLQTASALIEYGADRATIVRHLYQQKTLATLRLWGRVLARLQSDPTIKLVWSLIPRSDFEKSGGSPADLPLIIDEMIASSPQAGIVALLYENENSRVEAHIRLLRNHFNLMEILEAFAPSGNTQDVTLTLPEHTTLEQSEQLIVKRIQDYIKR